MRARLIAAAWGCALLAPATADAGQAVRTSREEVGERGGVSYVTRMTYVATPGTASHIAIRVEGGEILVHDSAGVEVGEGCAPVTRDSARCGHAASVEVDAGDGDDVVEAVSTSSSAYVRARGGDGRDRLTGSAVTISGDGGEDVLRSGGRGATLIGGPGADELLGGPAGGAVSYAEHTEPVYADLEGDADDGAAGEGDRIDPSITSLSGGQGADVIVGDARNNVLADGNEPYPGYDREGSSERLDRITAGGGDDLIDGGSADVISAGAGDDVVQLRHTWRGTKAGLTDAGPGDDRVSGLAYAERIVGGPGEDALHGLAGADDFDTDDGERDLARCGAGEGVARVDVLDVAHGCATVIRRAPARLVVSSGDRRYVALHCPSDHRRRCRARVRVTQRGRRLLDRRRALRPGTGASLRLRARDDDDLVARVDTRDAVGRPRTFRVALRPPVDRYRPEPSATLARFLTSRAIAGP